MQRKIKTQGRELFFRESYEESRDAFRKAVDHHQAPVQSFACSALGPDGGPLTVDCAMIGGNHAANLVMLSTGLHGAEGPLGSAVLLQFLESLRLDESLNNTRFLLIHSLNPYGHAHGRRFDAENIDLNRNFLLPEESYSGSPEIYQTINPFLNPQKPPQHFSGFLFNAAYYIARYGFQKVQQAIAGGQYDFEQGLFFGGHTASETKQIVEQNWRSWIGDVRRVIHLDFHTGLGKWGTYQLLSNHEFSREHQAELQTHFSHLPIMKTQENNIVYQTKGDFGHWCHQQSAEIDYCYLNAEFGTYGPLQMLRALRNENQYHHWFPGVPNPEHWSKKNLLEAFCPTSEKWRNQVLEQSEQLIQQAVRYVRSE
ncbi:MAG: hypothetical protein COA78_08520 [Blastopirellula sp.]|nr:MAG: hypothetical protein COA78_08520 [Blastopirellula sp.]